MQAANMASLAPTRFKASKTMTQVQPRLQAPFNGLTQTNVTGYVTSGIKERFRSYFLRYPNSTATKACLYLHLHYAKYGQIARNVKSELKRTYDLSYVKADSQNGLVTVHRQLFYVVGGLPVDVIRVLEPLAVQGLRGWYASRNRNRQLNFKSGSIFIRVLPVSRRCEVLSRIRDRRIDEVRSDFENILAVSLCGKMQGDYDPDFIAKQMKDRLVASERHKRFYIGATPFWEIRYYQTTLGLVFKKDLSETADQVETVESIPPWVPQLMDAFMGLGKEVLSLRLEIVSLRNRLRPDEFGNGNVGEPKMSEAAEAFEFIHSTQLHEHSGRLRGLR